VSHTPGPWEAVTQNDPRGQPSLFYSGLVAILEMSPDRRLTVVTPRRVQPSEWTANARLIAAAPELYAVSLRILRDCWERLPDEIVDELKEALAKAEGR
jgi:hypothetical protein